jgi:hypothetical protein
MPQAHAAGGRKLPTAQHTPQTLNHARNGTLALCWDATSSIPPQGAPTRPAAAMAGSHCMAEAARVVLLSLCLFHLPRRCTLAKNSYAASWTSHTRVQLLDALRRRKARTAA